jgi:hypothetical protein
MEDEVSDDHRGLRVGSGQVSNSDQIININCSDAEVQCVGTELVRPPIINRLVALSA